MRPVTLQSSCFAMFTAVRCPTRCLMLSGAKDPGSPQEIVVAGRSPGPNAAAKGLLYRSNRSARPHSSPITRMAWSVLLLAPMSQALGVFGGGCTGRLCFLQHTPNMVEHSHIPADSNDSAGSIFYSPRFRRQFLPHADSKGIVPLSLFAQILYIGLSVPPSHRSIRSPFLFSLLSSFLILVF